MALSKVTVHQFVYSELDSSGSVKKLTNKACLFETKVWRNKNYKTVLIIQQNIYPHYDKFQEFFKDK